MYIDGYRWTVCEPESIVVCPISSTFISHDISHNNHKAYNMKCFFSEPLTVRIFKAYIKFL